MFLSGTLLNVATVLLGMTLGLLAGRRLPARLGEGLTTGLGLFVAVILLGVALRLLDLKAVRVANFLPALVFAPLFLRVADLIRSLL
jgi:uncharacterized protein